MLGRIAKGIGARLPRPTAPTSVFVTYDYHYEWMAKLNNKTPDMSPDQARYIFCPKYALSYKAQAELDYQVLSVEQCITDALT